MAVDRPAGDGGGKVHRRVRHHVDGRQHRRVLRHHRLGDDTFPGRDASTQCMDKPMLRTVSPHARGAPNTADPKKHRQSPNVPGPTVTARRAVLSWPCASRQLPDKTELSNSTRDVPASKPLVDCSSALWRPNLGRDSPNTPSLAHVSVMVMLRFDRGDVFDVLHESLGDRHEAVH